MGPAAFRAASGFHPDTVFTVPPTPAFLSSKQGRVEWVGGENVGETVRPVAVCASQVGTSPCVGGEKTTVRHL